MRGRNRRRRSQTNAPASNSGQMMNLSLFIMLLAFFIVLNSVSSYEEIKAEQVRRSLLMAFSNENIVEEQKSSNLEDPLAAMKEGHTFDRLDALFRSQISSFEATQSQSRGVMLLQMPFDDFVTAVFKIGQKDLLRYPTRDAVRGNYFLPTLVSLLRNNIDGAPTRMEILIHTQGNPAQSQNQLPEEMKKTISTASGLSERLEQQGMPQKLISIGVKKGDPQMVELVFRKYTAFSPIEAQKRGEK
jgi:hypothetical protein